MVAYVVQMDGIRDYTLSLNVSQGVQEVANNRTLVHWSLVAAGTWGSYQSATTAWAVIIGGQAYSGNIGYANPNPSLTLASGTTWIQHNAEGQAQIYSVGYWDSAHSNIGAGQPAGILDLTTIPRASYAAWAVQETKYAGVAYALNTNRASTSFTHDITYTFGSASGTIGTGVTDSINWTIPLSLLAQFPNSATANGVITTKTYSGATLIGTTTSGFVVTVPTTAIPTWTSATATEGAAGVAAKIGAGAFVQGISKITHAIVGAAGVQGSTITQQRFQIENQTVDGASGTTPGVLTGSGSVPATFSATDSRGQKKTLVTNLNVLAYATPVIASFTAVRALSDGTVSPDNGTYLKVTLTAVVSSLINGTQKNTIGIRVYTKIRGATTFVLRQTVSPAGIAYNSNFLVTGPFAVDQAHDVRIEVFDQFSISAGQTTLAVAAIFMHWAPGGLGINKYHELGALDVGGPIYQAGQPVIDAADLATETAAGIMERATQAEVNAGTDAERAITPATLANGTNIPFRMATGRGVSSASGSVTITLPAGRFTQTPRVFVTPGSHTNVLVPRVAVDPTATSFQVQLWTMPGAGLVASNFDWVAVQMTSGSGSG